MKLLCFRMHKLSTTLIRRENGYEERKTLLLMHCQSSLKNKATKRFVPKAFKICSTVSVRIVTISRFYSGS